MGPLASPGPPTVGEKRHLHRIWAPVALLAHPKGALDRHSSVYVGLHGHKNRYQVMARLTALPMGSRHNCVLALSSELLQLCRHPYER